ncbi:hypothetical protein OG883_28870 [Streptomyces sp. NBC_01142]|uniref:hypothetical protein n=1 Tax=Streptomyces sp. NBC_01142 TaxID=2975865 RepID=UPI0022599C51|nr:hypothetical protein [Streptomyces sp. NBC_01142]MCX4823816.1 hypothetical protein [Streptomyces sp. NBC_01142]
MGTASWILSCTARYVPTWAVGWLCATAALTHAGSTRPGSGSFRAEFADNASLGVAFLLGTGTIALFVLVLLALCKKYGTTAGFRALAAGFLVVPLLPLAVPGGAPVGVAILTHLAFATLIMPKPPLREP